MQAKIYNWSGWITETDPDALRDEFTERLTAAGFRILDICEHYFEPYGYTALFLLAESHFAIHTFPEESQTYIELSSCVESQFLNFMQAGDESWADQESR